MFLAAPISGLMTSPAAFVRFVDTEQDREYERFFETDSFRSVVKSIKIAPGVAYPLRRECSAYFIPVKGEFIVEGFALVGRGNSSDEAEHDWKLKVHEAFQHLLAMRPFEMSDKDRQDWSVLSTMIDVAVYRNRTPVHVRQSGRISKVRPYPQEIKWNNGDTDSIDVQLVDSPDFVTYKAGQPFEAIVSRDPVDFRLLRIIHIERSPEPRQRSAQEDADFWKSLPSTRTLPDVGWV